MSWTLAAALLIQLGALAFVFAPLRGRAFGLLGPTFVAVAVLFHGVTEVVQLISPFENPYDPFASQQLVDEWVWVVSIAILIVAVSYILTLGRIEITRLPAAHRRFLDWRVLLVAAVPFYIVAVTGQDSYETNYWLGGLSVQFLVLTLALASFDFIRRNDGRYVVPVLLLQAAALALVGQRTNIVVGALLVIFALAWTGSPLKHRQALIVFEIAALLALTISSTRETTGRFNQVQGSGPTSRAAALATRAQELPHLWRSEGVWDDFVYRFDGNTYPAQIAAEIRKGRSPAGASGMADAALLAVPSFLYAGKNDRDLTVRDPKTLTSIHFGLPYGASSRVDFLPTTLGDIYAYLGLWGLWGGAVLFGVGFALIDRWFNARVTPPRLLTAMGVLLCVLSYEQGIQSYPLTLRGVLVLVVLVTVIRRGASLVRRRTPRLASSDFQVTGPDVGTPAPIQAQHP